MKAPGALLSIVSIAALLAATADARPVMVEGLVFSDESGGFTIVGATGDGSIADPFVIVEEITGPTAAVLVIRGLSPAFGNRVGTVHAAGFALRKVVTNRTPFTWTFTEFELQQELGVASDTYDGLSFGQGVKSGRPFRCDRFARVSQIDEPLDVILFSEGVLKPGESATFDVIVTDTTPTPVFYLVQRPNRPLARAPRRATRWAGGPPW